MSNWTAITAEDLKAAGHGSIVDSARQAAIGAVDPVAEDITNETLRVRRAVSAGNPLDTDATKIPASLKALLLRRVLYALMRRIGLDLSGDEKDTRREDNDDLKLIADRKVLVEAPDDPDPAAGPQNRGNWNSEQKLISRTHPVPAPQRQFPESTGNYANPDAPDDGDDA